MLLLSHNRYISKYYSTISIIMTTNQPKISGIQANYKTAYPLKINNKAVRLEIFIFFAK
jgi:hypothetical protein